MPKYEVDALRVIRSMQQSHEIAGHGPMAERLREVGDHVERMAGELAALKAAARPILDGAMLAKMRRQSAVLCPVEMVDKLAHLCGEEK